MNSTQKSDILSSYKFCVGKFELTIGVSLKPFSASEDGLKRWAPYLLSELGKRRLYYLTQEHGDTCLELNLKNEAAQQIVNLGHADAIVGDLEQLRGVVVGVKTADCLSVCMINANRFALVHAGWKGMANGILAVALQAIGGDSLPEFVFFGPGAAAESYSIGEEVRAQIGDSAAVSPAKGGGLLLDLEQTAINQLGIGNLEAGRIFSFPLRTIRDRELFSYRGDDHTPERNLTFLSIS